MKNILKIVLLLAVTVSYAQTTTKNYVKETIRRYPSTSPIIISANNHVTTTTYYDALGRPVQVVDQNSSPDNNKNIVTHIEYEKNIGQTKDYLPFTIDGGNDGGGWLPATFQSNFVENGKSLSLAFYNTTKYENTPNPYSENRIENSPRKRLLETGLPGIEWSLTLYDQYGVTEEYRNTIRTSYAFNTSNEVKRYSVSTTFSNGVYKNGISENGFYPDNTLTKVVVKNENWKVDDGNNNTVEEFKDTQGNVLLKRTYNNGEAHDTYYVYNKLNLLAFVIPPMANGTVLGDQLDKLCYQYHYDARKRLVEKKLPQKEWEFIIYDKADRVVLTGPIIDGFGLGYRGWQFTKYDIYGRIAYMGYYNGLEPTSNNRTVIADIIKSQVNTYEIKTTSNNMIDGILVKYSNDLFPNNSLNLFTVSYYDNYDYPNAPTSFPNVETQLVNTAVKGQLTGSWTRVLTDPSNKSGVLSYNLYDNKYRIIRSYSGNHLGGYTQVDSQLNFTGVPTKTVTYQKQNSSAVILTITDLYLYDQRDRLTKQTQQIGTGTVETIVLNTYDELGVLTTKKVGGTSGNLQTVDYKYNIRGWLTDINNADYFHNDTQNDLFQFKINYNNSVAGGKPLYNGNISSVFNRTKTDNIFRGYNYSYDHLNRLLLGKNLFYETGGWTMGVKNNDYYDEALAYDKNGNILTLNRTSKINDQKVDIDDLTYIYNGNQLQTVTDATNNNDGFKDGNKIGNDYAYDTFGNITQDKNKGITAVSYNHLNLPYQVTFANGSNIKYTYDATGTRLKKQVQPSGGALVTTDYVNGFQYENNILQFFPHAEGYVKRNTNNTYLYVYQYKDHLGNIRLSYADVNGNGTIQPASEILEENNYYPFGLKHKGYNEVVNSNRSEAAEKYKYNGKELNEDLGINVYEYEFRHFMPDIGRWGVVDGHSESYFQLSPYSYVKNNPINYIDFLGLDPIYNNGKYYDNGKEVSWDYVSNWIQKNDGIAATYTFKTNSDGNARLIKSEQKSSNNNTFIYNDKKYIANSYMTLMGRDDRNNNVGDFKNIVDLEMGHIYQILGQAAYIMYDVHNSVEVAMFKQSVGGKLDYKNVLYEMFGFNRRSLVQINGIVYNPNEAGNFLWAMVLSYYGSVFSANKIAEWGTRGRNDERWEQKAITAGRQYGIDLYKKRTTKSEELILLHRISNRE